MIVIKFQGGIGNQLFQYALGTSLANAMDTVVKFDCSYFASETSRLYQLDYFCNDVQIASSKEIVSIIFPYNFRLPNKALNFLKRHFPPIITRFIEPRRFIRENTLDFDPDIYKKISRNCYLDGYWQSQKYFLKSSDTLRANLTPQKELNSSLLKKIALIESTNSISLHIRRGDYVLNKEANDFHGVCSLDYYLKAIELMVNRVDTPEFFIFTDDVAWSKENLRIPVSLNWISGKEGMCDGDELWLMSRCKHHIIANSSFSWWGAWLSGEELGITIAPQKWFHSFQANLDDRLPDSWLRM